MRLFVAVYPPDEVRRHLRSRLDTAVAGRRVRLTRIEKWHITLAFLGEVPVLDGLVEALETVTVPRGLPLRLRGGGGFGGRVTWVGVEGELNELARDVRTAFKVGDPRPFHPHLTIMYAHDRAVREALDGYAGPPWTLDEIALVQSLPDGTYEVRFSRR
ncbi:RNA 2',3'-cyclic phosphodiesterase [Actinoplanes sp. TFC3]|uniref:RNA 2',3'-cyclic phosphodiesterase n=1 Tax=Actinoplanes sp. TFC3 TaxID=1710355 RepID=UPI00082EB975|nr:RNA 2',3'-cyclic phosphodiesterase [Actinoplanes sp. TFC3]